MMLASTNETDRLDVRGMNRLQRCRTLPKVWIPPEPVARPEGPVSNTNDSRRAAHPLCQGSCRVQVIGVTPQGVPPGEKSRAESEGAHAVFLEGVQEIDGSQDVRSRWS